jgi:hypothetical protein
MSEPIGEIVESSTTELLAQACQLGQAPAFGSLVKVEWEPGLLYGLVHEVRTGALEPGAQAVMRGRAEVRDEAIYRENPDLRAVLRTEFAALIVGFSEQGDPRHFLPPHPPALHWSVYECRDDESVAFTNRLDYFRTVLALPAGRSDELLAANIRLVARARVFEPGFTLRAGRELARLLKSDYDRLTAILRRLA